MHQCDRHCIYYFISYDKSRKPNYKLICDYFNKEMKINEERKCENCISHAEVRSKRLLTDY